MIVPSAVILILSGVLFDAAYGGCNVCGRPKSQYYEGTGKCYFLIDDQKLTWGEANDYCINEADGGQLALVTEQSITTILIEILEDCSHTRNFDAWIGLSSDSNSVWYWLEGNNYHHTELIVPPDYSNFDTPGNIPPANKPNFCGCIATPNFVTSIGQWFRAPCSLPQYFICEVPYTSPCQPPPKWGREEISIHCPKNGLCYTLCNERGRTWNGARGVCQAVPGGDLAIVENLHLNRALRNLVDGFAEIEWDAWIGLRYNNVAGAFQWVDNSFLGAFNSFPAWPTVDADWCVAMFGLGYWKLDGCDEHKWFFCQSDEFLTVCCDPHFMVKPRGIKDHICFDYYGEDKDVLQLVYSQKYNLAVNAEVFSHPHTKKTWFEALSVIAPRCTLVADTKGIKLNARPVEWTDIEDQPCGSSGVTYSIRNDVHRNSTHLIIRVMPGVEFVFTKDEKTYNFGTVEYMDFDMTKHYGLDETTDGILGEFLGMRVSLDEDPVGNDTDTGILYFPEEPGRGYVTAHRVHRKNLLTKQHFSCWNVEDEGAGLLRGVARDYLVPDILTGQRAQNFHQMEEEEEEEEVDAIF